YADCQALAEALRGWVDGSATPVPAAQPEAEAPRALWLGWALIGLAACLLLVVTMAGGGIWLVTQKKLAAERRAAAGALEDWQLLADAQNTLALAAAELTRRDKLPKTVSVDLGGGMQMEFVLIREGKFSMGSPLDEKDRNLWEKNFDAEKQHEVEITRPFYLA